MAGQIRVVFNLYQPELIWCIGIKFAGVPQWYLPHFVDHVLNANRNGFIIIFLIGNNIRTTFNIVCLIDH